MGNAAILITKIIYIKEGYKKDFIILDAAMNDLLDLHFMELKHKIIPLNKTRKNFKKKFMNL